MTQPPNDPNQWRAYGGQPPQWAPPVPPPPVQIPARTPFWRSKKGAFVLLVGALFLAIVMTPKSQPAATSTSTARIPYTPPQVISAVPAAKPGTAAPAPAAPAQSSGGPATTLVSGDGAFGESTYEVGTDVAPGKYRTDGPTSGDSCYWARLKNTDGDLDSIIANGNAGGRTTVTIAKTDGAFQLRGGGCTWTKVG